MLIDISIKAFSNKMALSSEMLTKWERTQFYFVEVKAKRKSEQKKKQIDVDDSEMTGKRKI